VGRESPVLEYDMLARQKGEKTVVKKKEWGTPTSTKEGTNCPPEEGVKNHSRPMRPSRIEGEKNRGAMIRKTGIRRLPILRRKLTSVVAENQRVLLVTVCPAHGEKKGGWRTQKGKKRKMRGN